MISLKIIIFQFNDLLTNIVKEGIQVKENIFFILRQTCSSFSYKILRAASNFAKI